MNKCMCLATRLGTAPYILLKPTGYVTHQQV